MEKIDDDTRKRFATGCNQHIRQPGAKILDDTKEKAFELFRSDEEKQKYLDIHGHDTELVAFCASRGEFQSIIWHLVLKGNLELVLKESLLTQENRPWPPEVDRDGFLDEVYRVLKTRRLFEALSGSNDVPESIFTSEEEFKSMPWAERWYEQMNTCRGILEKGAFLGKQSLDPSTAEFISGLVSSPWSSVDSNHCD